MENKELFKKIMAEISEEFATEDREARIKYEKDNELIISQIKIQILKDRKKQPFLDCADYFFIFKRKKLNFLIQYLSTLPGVEKLPEDLVIYGDLILEDSDLVALPQNLIVHGRLDLCGSQIKHIPDGVIADKIHTDQDESSLTLRGKNCD